MQTRIVCPNCEYEGKEPCPCLAVMDDMDVMGEGLEDAEPYIVIDLQFYCEVCEHTFEWSDSFGVELKAPNTTERDEKGERVKW